MIEIIKSIFNKNSRIIFVFILLCLGLYFNFHKTSFYRPQGIHTWRQADGASFALNYYQHGMNFFKPELHHLKADNQTTGFEVSEAPILYYFVATVYCIFGCHDYLFRIINGLIFFIGLYYLFRTLELWTTNSLFSILASLLFFCSPVLVYYSNNFLPNSTALAFVLIAWFHFSQFYFHSKNKSLFWYFFFFVLAGWLKVISLMSLNVLFIIFILEHLKWIRFENEIFTKKRFTALGFTISYFFVVIWYVFVYYYNLNHKTQYFNNRTIPIWNLNWSAIVEYFFYIKQLWFNQYFHFYIFRMYLVILVITIIIYKKINILLKLIVGLMLLQVLVFVILWYCQFHDHDYYFLDLYIVFILGCLPLFNFISKYKVHLILKLIVYFSVFIFLLPQLKYTKNCVNYRYDPNGWMNHEAKDFQSLSEIKPYLHSLSILQTDKIICVGDYTNCYSLYLMNHAGWTQMSGLNSDSVSICKLKRRGAKYLILKSEADKKPLYLKSFTKNLIGKYKEVSVYKI